MLINNIKKKFGDDLVLVMGDWSIGKQMKHFISTPNLGLKRKLDEHFTIVSIDEYKTSKINCVTKKENENLIIYNKEIIKRMEDKRKLKEEENIKKDNKIKEKEKKEITSVKLHSVLTYKMKNKRLGCINRDKNAVRNMQKITKQWLLNGKRPKVFCRETKNENNP